jgi:F-type H+-transporting ATPase subunit epsilon
MPKLKLEITTPERTVWSEEVDSVTVPAREGEITVLPNHVPLVGLVISGALTIRQGNAEKYLAVSGGVIKILAGSRCVILTDSADRAEDLVLAEIEKAKERAHNAFLESKNKDEVAYADAAAGLERELARLKVARRHRGQLRNS